MNAMTGHVMSMRAGPAGLNRMVSVSLALHLLFVAALFLVPRDWLGRPRATPVVMTLNLSGSLGEKTGGMNPAPARPIEEVAPQPKRPEPIRPAAPKPNAMTVPTKDPKTPPPKTTAKPPSPIARPPTKGLEVRQGTSAAETGSTVQGTGLSMGGGVGASGSFIEAEDFCCMEWAKDMIRQIQNRWRMNQSDRGETILKFTVLRDGSIVEVSVEKPSGSGILDRTSIDALPAKLAQPLPKQYPEERLVIHLKFPYQAR